MAWDFDPDALLDRWYVLARGPRVRLRLAQARDAVGIASLLRRTGADPEALQIARLVRFDPRRSVVICASALVGSSETIAGVGAIELGSREPDTLLVDHELTDGLESLLRRALRERSDAGGGRRAA